MSKKTYDVASLAADLNIEPKTVRLALRRHGFEKNSETGTYGWTSASEYAAVVKKLKSGAGDDKPSKKAEKKAPAKKVASKKVASKKAASDDEGDGSNE